MSPNLNQSPRLVHIPALLAMDRQRRGGVEWILPRCLFALTGSAG